VGGGLRFIFLFLLKDKGLERGRQTGRGGRDVPLLAGVLAGYTRLT
jgi:hypothetical protein